MPDGLNGLRHVYVLNITIFGEYELGVRSHHAGWCRARLEQKVDEYDVRDAYELEAHYESHSDNVIASEQDGDMVTWTITCLPVETPSAEL